MVVILSLISIEQVVKIAKAWTKDKNESKAIKKFRSQLERDDFFYTVENENYYSELYMKCYDEETAKIFCPRRWKAMTRWLQSAEAVGTNLRCYKHYRVE
jgi:hypothetical protein